MQHYSKMHLITEEQFKLLQKLSSIPGKVKTKHKPKRQASIHRDTDTQVLLKSLSAISNKSKTNNKRFRRVRVIEPPHKTEFKQTQR